MTCDVETCGLLVGTVRQGRRLGMLRPVSTAAGSIGEARRVDQERRLGDVVRSGAGVGLMTLACLYSTPAWPVRRHHWLERRLRRNSIVSLRANEQRVSECLEDGNFLEFVAYIVCASARCLCESSTAQ